MAELSTAGKNSCHIKVYSGRIFYVLDPRVEDVDIKDIAHALSNQGRFSGHTNIFYSVAEHSVRVSYKLPTELALIGLLHDATEAYLVDLPSPIKRETKLGEYYSEIEDNLWRAIAKRYELPEEIPTEIPEIKIADKRMLVTEMRDLMGGFAYSDYAKGIEPYQESIIPIATPFQAEQLFLDRFYELTDHTIHEAAVVLDYGRCL